VIRVDTKFLREFLEGKLVDDLLGSARRGWGWHVSQRRTDNHAEPHATARTTAKNDPKT